MGLAFLRLPWPRVSQRGENPEIKPGERIQALPQLGKAVFGLTELLADGPEHGANSRGLSRGDLQQALEAPGFTKVFEQLLDRLLGRQLAQLPPVAKEVKERGIRLGQRPPRRRPSCVDERVLAKEKAREARAIGRQFDPGRILSRETQEVCCRDACRKDPLADPRPGIGCGPCWACSVRRPSAAAGSTGPCLDAGLCLGGAGGTAFAPRQ